MNQSRLAVLSVVVLSAVGFAGCPSGPDFNPQGSWDLSFDRIEAFSTYTRSPAINSTIPAESLVPVGTDLTVATGVVITYDAAARTVDLSGTTYALDGNNSFDVGTTEVPMPFGGCNLVEYQKGNSTFTGEAGHTASLVVESGYRFETTGVPTCETSLLPVKAVLQSGGPIPADLNEFLGFGAFRIATMEQLLTLGLRQVIAGERVSASAAAPGSASVETFEFVNAYDMDALVALRRQMLPNVRALFIAE